MIEAEEAIINNPLDEIEFLDYTVEKRKFDIENIEQIISDKKDEMFLIVESEYEDDKKSVFLSNADKRKIEAKRRLQLDPSYLKAEEDLYDLREVQMVEEVRLRALKRQFVREYGQGKMPI
jgi:ABC-type lipopolysaccharide export system ATPase subunit